MPFTRVGGISHVIGGGDCPRLAKQSQLYSPVFCGMPGDRAVTRAALFVQGTSWGKSAGVEDAAVYPRV